MKDMILINDINPPYSKDIEVKFDEAIQNRLNQSNIKPIIVKCGLYQEDEDLPCQ